MLTEIFHVNSVGKYSDYDWRQKINFIGYI